jgi:hypothetical protein
MNRNTATIELRSIRQRTNIMPCVARQRENPATSYQYE